MKYSLHCHLVCCPSGLIYQDGFPTLTAFTEFVSEFDMPSGPNTKKKDADLEIGRPFEPAMFEGVLNNFTPDISCGISGRPRYVNDCIEIFYLSSFLAVCWLEVELCLWCSMVSGVFAKQYVCALLNK